VTGDREPWTITWQLDTSAISTLMRDDAGITAWLASTDSKDRIVTCAIARGEILVGTERLAFGRRRTILQRRAARVFATLP
jgi:predicted nucleic acid-binding protein